MFVLISLVSQNSSCHSLVGLHRIRGDMTEKIHLASKGIFLKIGETGPMWGRRAGPWKEDQGEEA